MKSIKAPRTLEVLIWIKFVMTKINCITPPWVYSTRLNGYMATKK